MTRLTSRLSAVAAMVAAVAFYAAVASGHDGGSRGDGAHHGGQTVKQALAPSLPTDPPFHSVTPGAAPWVIRHGDVRIKMRGRLELELRGLVIPNPPGDGTPGPVKTVSASLYCGADSEATPADTTPAVPISPRGDARIRDRSFAVPSTCLAPLVLVHPNNDTTKYIAVTGWRR